MATATGQYFIIHGQRLKPKFTSAGCFEIEIEDKILSGNLNQNEIHWAHDEIWFRKEKQPEV